MNGNGRKQQQLAHRAGAVGREGLVKTVSSSPIPPVWSEYVHTSTEWQKPDGHFRFQVRPQLRSVTKITPFEFFCVNKSPTLYGFRVGATGKSYKLLSGMYCDHSLMLSLQFNARNVFS